MAFHSHLPARGRRYHWLYRIALNTAIKWTRREKKHTGAKPLDSVHYLLEENKTSIDERLTWPAKERRTARTKQEDMHFRY